MLSNSLYLLIALWLIGLISIATFLFLVYLFLYGGRIKHHGQRKLHALLEEELRIILTDAWLTGKSPALKDIQPTTWIIKYMAKAAACVAMAFERGFRIGE
jgi:hypothetical protein